MIYLKKQRRRKYFSTNFMSQHNSDAKIRRKHYKEKTERTINIPHEHKPPFVVVLQFYFEKKKTLLRCNLYIIKCTLLKFGQIHISIELSQQLRNRTSESLSPQKVPSSPSAILFPLQTQITTDLLTIDYFACSRISNMKSYSFVTSLCSAGF